MTTIYLTHNRCPKHGFESVSLDGRDTDGNGSGTRLTPAKCCGTWIEQKRWAMSASDLRRAAREFEAAADLLDEQEESR